MSPDIRSLFDWDDPSVIKLTEEVFDKCILGKVNPAEPPFEQEWIAPGGCYVGQWIWDTMFVVDLLSLIPGTEETIRGVFQNYWDFQERWNKGRPSHMHNMIVCSIKPDSSGLECRQFSQIPILAWGLERVYKRNGDRDLLQQCISPLEAFHEWYWRERDVTGNHLLTVGTYNEGYLENDPDWDPVQQSRFETYDLECNLDDLQLTKHPTRNLRKEGKWYGDVCLPGMTSYLVLAEKCLARMALELGETDMAERRMLKADAATAAVNKHMWDEVAGLYFAVQRDTMEKIRIGTIGSWIPLHAGIPTPEQASRMAETFLTDSWQTPLPIPTVDRNDKRFESDRFWRGDVWPPPNYQAASGFADYGFTDIAADIADKTIANAIENGISERYDSLSGKKLGVEYLGMTCTIITMMLDGLSDRYRLDLR